MIPIVGTLPSAYKAYKLIGLIDSPLILLTATDVLGGANFLIVYAFYKGISWNYAEAAFIDGANNFQVYFKIMFRMALPAISVLFITGFIGRWNEYLNISIFKKIVKKSE
jgi:raffinose/stachyose/melibiose transport system permease protein/N-acetylglucosamine transport system permease protein